MPSQTQEKMVIDQLKANGYVSRNWALQNYISRLGAIVYSLKKDGWNIVGEYKHYENGKDFIYRLKGDAKQEPLFKMSCYC